MRSLRSGIYSVSVGVSVASTKMATTKTTIFTM
jgi:hypothetical protein